MLPAILATVASPQWRAHLVMCTARELQDCGLLCGVQLFSGERQLTQAFRDHIGPFGCFEMLNNLSEHNLTTEGMNIAIGLVLNISVGGLLWLGAPCKSWVVMSRSFTGRSSIQAQGPPPEHCKSVARVEHLKMH